MADVFFDYNHVGGLEDGSFDDPFLTFGDARTAATVNVDIVVAKDGIQTHESNLFALNKDVGFEAFTFRGSTLRANPSFDVLVLRIGTGLTAANNPHILRNLIVDGEGRVDSAIQHQEDAIQATIVLCENFDVIMGTEVAILNSMRQGEQSYINARIRGDGGNAGYNTTSVSATGDQIIRMIGTVFDLDFGSAVNDTYGIRVFGVNNTTNTAQTYIQGSTGVINLLVGSGRVDGILIISSDTTVISGSDFTVNTIPGVTGTCINVYGQSSAPVTDMVVSGNRLRFNGDSGHAILAGIEGADGFVTGGDIVGNVAIGQYFSTATPHGITIGQATSNIQVRGNTSIGFFVGLIASVTTSGENSGNFCFDCYGPSLYTKGTVDVEWFGNTLVVSSAARQRNLGIIAVVRQDGNDTQAANIHDNVTIVQDVSTINSLAQIATDQVCTMARDIFMIPDTVAESAILFKYKTANQNDPPNQTLAQWNANPEITDDAIIVRMPQSQIDLLIEQYRQRAASAAGDTSGIIFGIIQPVIR